MDLKHQCSNCEFNFKGVCAGSSVSYGQKIVVDTQCCEDWSANLEYFTCECASAPRFLREKYHDCYLTYSDFSKQYSDFREGVEVPINIFDAIKYVYGLSMVDVAVLTDVTYCVVFQAKTKRIPKKRIRQFCDILCISEDTLMSDTTAVFDELRKGSAALFTQDDVADRLSAIPDWKQKIINFISDSFLHCSNYLAREFARIDKLYWTTDMPMDEYTDSEKAFIQYCLKQYRNVSQIEYALDMTGLPHISIRST